VAQIIGYLDQQALARQLVQAGGIMTASGAPFTGTDSSGNPIPVPVFSTLTCPDDTNNAGISGGLSYAANAGYINWISWANVNSITLLPNPDSGTGAHDSTMLLWSWLAPPAPGWPGEPWVDGTGPSQPIARATGIFWRNEYDGFRMTTDFVSHGDGFGYTLLLAENIDSGFWADITAARRDLQTGYIAFGLSVTFVKPDLRYPDPHKSTGLFGTVYGSNNYLVTQPGFALTDGPGANDATINSNLTTAAIGASPRPSSNHPGIVLFCFADGHALPLSQTIDPLVYMRAISCAGSLYGQ
jgi:hypothetical protein